MSGGDRLTEEGSHDGVRGGIYGLLIGDALGVPYEFKKPSALPRRDFIEFDPPPGFERSHAGVARGSWSDDGAQALCLLASLLHSKGLDLEDLGRRFRNWFDFGYLAPNGHVFDIGIQTSRALSNLRSGVAAEAAGPTGEWDNGNGSLMRVLPLALWHRGSDQELFDDACRQSLVTHGHPRSQICCAIYSLWARYELQSRPEPWAKAKEVSRTMAGARPGWVEELEKQVDPDRGPGGDGSGYVVDCLHSARLALEEASFEAVVKKAVSLGNDTDTTAAVAGGIAGIRFGFSGIPVRWIEDLVDRDRAEALVVELVSSMQ